MPEDRDESHGAHIDVADELQRQVGLVIAAASIALVLINYFATLEHDVGAGPRWAHPTVLVTALWAVLAGITAVKIGRTGKAVQVAMVVVVMFQSVTTSVETELTSALFLGIAIALAYAYGFFGRYLWVFFIVTSAALVGGIAFRMVTLGLTVPWYLGQWLIGAMMVMGIYAAIYRTTNRWVRSRQQQLEQRVDERTLQLRQALSDSKELNERNLVLLREVQHRTKNNLQLITSLLSLQQSDPDVESRAVADVLETTRRRIQAMATAHDLLHSSGRTSTISLKQFVLELTNEFVRSDRVNDVHVDTPLDSDVAVEMDFAAPLGLIITELVANSAEHAAVPDGERAVWIQLALEDSTIDLTVEDRGTQFSDNISIDSPTTTGLQIIAALVSQIRGEINLERTPNTKWMVRVPLPSPTVEDDEDSATGPL